MLRLVDDARDSDEPVTAIYIRVTRKESVLTDLSIPNQRYRALEICTERGWLRVKLYIEPRHVSAKLLPPKRPALAELLADVEAGRVARVLSRHTDRIWRGSRVQDIVMDALRRNAVELWDFGGQRELRSAAGRFSLQVLGAAAELETSLTGERVQEMKRGKAHAGNVGGGPPPFGYVSQLLLRREYVKAGMNEDEAELAAVARCPLSRAWYVDDEDAKVVRLIFDLYVMRRFGSRRISNELNRRGLRRRSGFKWNPVKVLKVLNNPSVAGLTSYDEDAYQKGLPSKAPRYRQTLYTATHEAIVPLELWHEAQRLKRDTNVKMLRTKTSASARVYPLLHVLRCADCRGPMVGKSSGAKRGARYMCARRAYDGPVHGCAGPTVTAAWAEDAVLQYLDRLFRTPEMVEEIFRRTAVKVRSQEPEAKNRLADVRAAIAELDAKQRKWMEKYEDAKDDGASEMIWARLKELRAKQLALTEEAKALESRAVADERPALTPEAVAAALAKIPALGEAEPEKRRVLVERLVRRHDLRVHLVDMRRLAVSLRLDEAENDNDAAVGQRLVMVGGAGPVGSSGRQNSARMGQVFPGRPMPGEPTSRRLWPPATAISVA